MKKGGDEEQRGILRAKIQEKQREIEGVAEPFT